MPARRLRLACQMTDEYLPDDPIALRQCLGHFATGVTVVTCAAADGSPRGITANSFSSVSLEPPLVLWNIAKVSNSLQAYLGAEHFAINILAADQESVSNHFARTDHTRFNGIDFTLSTENVPVLADTVACLHCRTHQIHDCGDHFIIIGEVIRLRLIGGKPLIFFDGKYAGLT